MESISEFSIFLLLPFVAGAIYFFIKGLQFFDQATNLYHKIVRRQDAVLKLLVDIRDNTVKFDLRTLYAEEDTAVAKPKPATPRFTYSQGVLRAVEDIQEINQQVSGTVPGEDQNRREEDEEEAKRQAIIEMVAAKYESSRQPIVAELREAFDSDNKREILDGLSQLDYYKLAELAKNPGDQLTETGRVVCRALVDKIESTYGEGEKISGAW